MKKTYQNLTSKAIRESQLLLRNDYLSDNKWDISIVKRTDIDFSVLKLMGYDKTKENESKNFDKTIHFFLDDHKIQVAYRTPQKCRKKLAQYRNVITPDFSIYRDMPLAKQIDAVFNNRWCGAYWQEMDLSVIPSVSWGDYNSFEFAFTGVEKGSTVAISTVGNRRCIDEFMRGMKK